MLGIPRNIEGTATVAGETFNLKTYLKTSLPGNTGPDVSALSVHLQIDNQDQQKAMYISFDNGDSWLPIAADGSWDGEVRVYSFKTKSDNANVAWRGIASFA